MEEQQQYEQINVEINDAGASVAAAEEPEARDQAKKRVVVAAFARRQALLRKQKAKSIGIRCLVVFGIILLMMIIYGAAVTSWYGDYYERITYQRITPVDYLLYVDFFSTMGKSMLTLFQCLTWDGWAGISRAVMIISSPNAWVVFLTFVGFGTFVAFQILVILLCDSVISTETGQLREQLTEVHTQAEGLQSKLDDFMTRMLQQQQQQKEEEEAETNGGGGGGGNTADTTTTTTRTTTHPQPWEWSLPRMKQHVFMFRLLYVGISFLFIFFLYAGIITSRYCHYYRNGLTSEDYFSSFGASLYTIFQVYTTDRWSGIAREVIVWGATEYGEGGEGEGGGAVAFTFCSLVVLTNFIAIPILIMVVCNGFVSVEALRLQQKLTIVQEQRKSMETKLNDIMMTKLSSSQEQRSRLGAQEEASAKQQEE